MLKEQCFELPETTQPFTMSRRIPVRPEHRKDSWPVCQTSQGGRGGPKVETLITILKLFGMDKLVILASEKSGRLLGM